MHVNTQNSLDANWSSLHFEQRQAAWTGAKRVFRQLHGRTERPVVWEIWVEGDTYYTRHGLLDGKMQETSKKGKHKNKGRSNELTPEADALAEARRLCRKKWDFEGYDEFVGDTNIDKRGGRPSIPHLLSDLPGSFALYKPHNNIKEAKGLWKKAQEGKVIYTRKRNGLAMWVVIDAFGEIHMYSRRNRRTHKDEGPKENPDGTLSYNEVIPWVSRFPHLVQVIQQLNLPPSTMMACELVHPMGDTKREFAHVQGVEKSLTPRSLELQKDICWVTLYWWDIPFYDGNDLVSTVPVSERYIFIHDIINNTISKDSFPWIEPIDFRSFSYPSEAEQFAKDHGWEGWVVVDPNGIYGDKAWNLKGKPDRPSKFCAKLKPWYEDDFIVRFDPDNGWGEWGKGRHEPGKLVQLPGGEEVVHGGVGSVGLGQYNNQGELVYICDCSSGMSYEFQAKLRPESFPMVWEVQYVERSYISDGDETNALTFPKLLRVREDKGPDECINTDL